MNPPPKRIMRAERVINRRLAIYGHKPSTDIIVFLCRAPE